MAPLAIRSTGLVTAVGFDAATSCAAFHAKVTNPTPTPYMNSAGDWIMAHRVAPDIEPGSAKLAWMAVLAMEEALADVERAEWPAIPMILCLAERGRPGHAADAADELVRRIGRSLDIGKTAGIQIIEAGRVGVALGLDRARQRLARSALQRVLIVAVDSLLDWETLIHHDRHDRVLREDHSNGFIPGEGAGAMLVGAPTRAAELTLVGLGYGLEPAPFDSDQPTRADGLVAALNAATEDAGGTLHDFDFRIADLSGEQYYFREAALALARTLRPVKTEFDLWHPADCIGEAGALAGAAIVAWADAACRKGYAPGPRIVAHLANDGGERAAMALHFRSAS